QDRQKFQLTPGRECGLRFVHQIQPCAAKAVPKQGEERLAVRLLLQGSATVCLQQLATALIQPFNLGRHVEETLSPQEVAIARVVDCPGDAETRVQIGVGCAGGEVEVSAASFRVEAD